MAGHHVPRVRGAAGTLAPRHLLLLVLLLLARRCAAVPRRLQAAVLSSPSTDGSVRLFSSIAPAPAGEEGGGCGAVDDLGWAPAPAPCPPAFRKDEAEYDGPVGAPPPSDESESPYLSESAPALLPLPGGGGSTTPSMTPVPDKQALVPPRTPSPSMDDGEDGEGGQGDQGDEGSGGEFGTGLTSEPSSSAASWVAPVAGTLGGIAGLLALVAGARIGIVKHRTGRFGLRSGRRARPAGGSTGSGTSATRAPDGPPDARRDSSWASFSALLVRGLVKSDAPGDSGTSRGGASFGSWSNPLQRHASPTSPRTPKASLDLPGSKPSRESGESTDVEPSFAGAFGGGLGTPHHAPHPHTTAAQRWQPDVVMSDCSDSEPMDEAPLPAGWGSDDATSPAQPARGTWQNPIVAARQGLVPGARWDSEGSATGNLYPGASGAGIGSAQSSAATTQALLQHSSGTGSSEPYTSSSDAAGLRAADVPNPPLQGATEPNPLLQRAAVPRPRPAQGPAARGPHLGTTTPPTSPQLPLTPSLAPLGDASDPTISSMDLDDVETFVSANPWASAPPLEPGRATSGAGSSRSGGFHGSSGSGGGGLSALASQVPPDWLIPAADVAISRHADGSEIQLGAGSYGRVFRGLRDGVADVALKLLPAGTTRDEHSFVREVATLATCRSPNVVQFLGVAFVPGAAALVTELMAGGDLRNALDRSRGEFQWRRKGALVARDVTRGLHYLHRLGIVHFDLKSPNVLLSAGGCPAKIADVGLAAALAGGQTGTSGALESDGSFGGPAPGEAATSATDPGPGHDSDPSSGALLRGTWAWAAPEVVLGAPTVNEKADLYSLGVVLWEIATLERPSRGGLRDIRPDEAPARLARLIDACLQQDPQARPSAKQAYLEIQACLQEDGRGAT